MKTTNEEVEALKRIWIKDPCWDIEDTGGFEAYHDELLAWRKEQDRQFELKKQDRADFVREQTGVADADIVSDLWTWREIERAVESQDEYLGAFSTRESIIMAELAMAHTRAILLQAAQLKRIADVLENMNDGDSLVTSVRSCGGK
jgi:hypothetical protein